MGSPLDPILTSIFVAYYERKVFKDSVDPNMYVGYMADKFVIFKNKNVVIPFLMWAFNEMTTENITLKHTENQKCSLV